MGGSGTTTTTITAASTSNDTATTIEAVQRCSSPPTTYGCSLNSPAFLALQHCFHNNIVLMVGNDDQIHHCDEQRFWETKILGLRIPRQVWENPQIVG